jgi:hypothetical protein
MKYLIAIVMLSVAACGGGGSPRSSVLLTGFFGSDCTQVQETMAFTNMHWESFFIGEQCGLDNIAAAKKPTVIDVSMYLFDGVVGSHTLKPDAEASLQSFHDRLGYSNQYIAYVYTMDEPDIQGISDADLMNANRIARKVFNKPLAVIFAGITRLTRIEDYDLVGFDEYEEGAKIFEVSLTPWPPMSDYDRLIKRLRPDQKVMLVGGGGDPWKQDPTAFYAKANSDGRVEMIVNFLWINRYESDMSVVQGIRNNGMAKTYCMASGLTTNC